MLGGQYLFFTLHWQISVICPIIVLKPTVTALASLYFWTSWRWQNDLIFFGHYIKISVYDRKKPYGALSGICCADNAKNPDYKSLLPDFFFSQVQKHRLQFSLQSRKTIYSHFCFGMASLECYLQWPETLWSHTQKFLIFITRHRFAGTVITWKQAPLNTHILVKIKSEGWSWWTALWVGSVNIADMEKMNVSWIHHW